MSDRARADHDLVSVVAACAKAFGAHFGLVLREPRHSAAFREALGALHQGTGFFLSIKRDVLLGKALGAQGLHLGGGPFDPELVAHARREGLVVSAAAHSEADLRDATRLGISAVLVSPIFAVPGKGPERGLGALTEARRLAPDAAVFALGGITPATAAACYEAGAHGIAVQRALLDATDPVAAARALLPREIAEHDLRSSSPL